MKTVVIWNFLGVHIFFALIILMWAALGLTSAWAQSPAGDDGPGDRDEFRAQL